MRSVVVAVGQSVAGDDAVGLVVVDELERRGVDAGVELLRLRQPLDLVSVFAERARLILVDALLAAPPGVVVELGLEDLSRQAAEPASSHGMGVVQAAELARVLYPSVESEVRVVAVTIDAPRGCRVGLSPVVADAVPVAVARIVALLGGRTCTSHRLPNGSSTL